MKLPDAEQAIIETSKLTDYLLNPAHPEGAGKAGFFGLVGFTRDEPQTLAAALRALAVNSTVTKSLATTHGVKYILEGAMDTPVGRQVRIRSVWAVDAGVTAPRLVTAYPLKS